MYLSYLITLERDFNKHQGQGLCNDATTVSKVGGIDAQGVGDAGGGSASRRAGGGGGGGGAAGPVLSGTSAGGAPGVWQRLSVFCPGGLNPRVICISTQGREGVVSKLDGGKVKLMCGS